MKDGSAALSDAGLYSYAALCGWSLNVLFGDFKLDRDFVKETVEILAKHLHLTRQVKDTINAFAEGEGSSDPYPLIEILREEVPVKRFGPQIIICDLLEVMLSDGAYDARRRTLVKNVGLLLQVEPDVVEAYEDSIVDKLSQGEHQMTEQETKEKESRERRTKIKRYALITIATVGGGALLGLTGGLAAPLLAAGLGAVIGTGGLVLGTTAGVAVIGSLFGVAGAGLGAYKMKKRMGAIDEFMFEALSEGQALHVTIAVPGWITEYRPDCRTAWLGLADSQEQYVLRYETQHLKKFGHAMDYLTSFAVSAATQQALQYTVLSGVLAAITWPAALLTASCVIDNPWSVCAQRAINVGRQLAEVLLTRQQGNRPVTLIGFSVGARVIFYCLEELSKRKGGRGLIEDTILLGAPVTGNTKQWESISSIVAGKVINGYSRSDWLLKFLYRTTSFQMEIAGLEPIKSRSRRLHNIDLTDLVKGHTDYVKKMDDILAVLGIKTRPHISEDNWENSLHQLVEIQKNSPKKHAPLVSLSRTSSGLDSTLCKSPSSNLDLKASIEKVNLDIIDVNDTGELRLKSEEITADPESGVFSCSDPINSPNGDQLVDAEIATPRDDVLFKSQINSFSKDELSHPGMNSPKEDLLSKSQLNSFSKDELSHSGINTPKEDELSQSQINSFNKDELSHPGINTPKEDELSQP